MEGRPACGRCNPPCDNVISYRCGLCRFEARVYDWDTEPTLAHQAHYTHYEPIENLAWQCYVGTRMHLDPEWSPEWGDQDEWPEEECKAWVAGLRRAIGYL